MNKLLITLTVLLISSIFIIKNLIDSSIENRNEIDRLSINLLKKDESEKFYKTKSGLQAAKINSLNYTLSEFKQIEAELYREVKELKLQVRNLKSVTSINTSTVFEFTEPLVKQDSVTCFTYKDSYNSIIGCIFSDSISITAHYTDSLIIAITEIPKFRFLWWSWGIKAVELDVVSKNPSTSIKHVRYFELKNKFNKKNRKL